MKFNRNKLRKILFQELLLKELVTTKTVPPKPGDAIAAEDSGAKQAAAEAEKITRMNAQSTGEEQGAGTTGKIAALEPGSAGTGVPPSQAPGAEVISRKEDKDLEELKRWSKLAGIGLNEQDIDFESVPRGAEENLVIQTEDPPPPPSNWRATQGTKQDRSDPKVKLYINIKKELEEEGFDPEWLEDEIIDRMGGEELDQVTENSMPALEEVHSAKQRRYMCAMKDKSADERPKGLSKGEASEMCSAPMKESKQHLKTLVLRELEQMREQDEPLTIRTRDRAMTWERGDNLPERDWQQHPNAPIVVQSPGRVDVHDAPKTTQKLARPMATPATTTAAPETEETPPTKPLKDLKELVLRELEQMRAKGGVDPKSIDTIKAFVKQALLQEIDGGIMDPGMVPFVPHREPAADPPIEDEEPLEVDKKYDVALDAREATERLIMALDNAIYDAPYEHAFKATMSLRDALNSLEGLGAQPNDKDRVVAPLKDEQPMGYQSGRDFMPMTYTGDTIS